MLFVPRKAVPAIIADPAVRCPRRTRGDATNPANLIQVKRWPAALG